MGILMEISNIFGINHLNIEFDNEGEQTSNHFSSFTDRGLD